MTRNLNPPKRTPLRVSPWIAATALAVTALCAPPANAVLISNKDTRTYTVVIEERGQTSSHAIEPTSSLDGICLKGCVARLEGVDDGAYRLPEGNEIVTIEDAVMYYEGAAPPEAEAGVDAEPGTGAGEDNK